MGAAKVPFLFDIFCIYLEVYYKVRFYHRDINAANNILKQGLKELGLSYIKIH